MIASVHGKVLTRRPGEVVIECGGVGYKLAVSDQTLEVVPSVGKKAALHVHMVLRDDSINLFGFATESERDLFLMLVGVQGVGPKVAQAVLSGGPPRELLGAMADGDAARFQAVPGIGKRTAERIIVELKDKVAGLLAEEMLITRTSGSDPRAVAHDGLLGLGYSPQEADSLLESVVGDSPEDLISEALRAAR